MLLVWLAVLVGATPLAAADRQAFVAVLAEDYVWSKIKASNETGDPPAVRDLLLAQIPTGTLVLCKVERNYCKSYKIDDPGPTTNVVEAVRDDIDAFANEFAEGDGGPQSKLTSLPRLQIAATNAYQRYQEFKRDAIAAHAAGTTLDDDETSLRVIVVARDFSIGQGLSDKLNDRYILPGHGDCFGKRKEIPTVDAAAPGADTSVILHFMAADNQDPFTLDAIAVMARMLGYDTDAPASSPANARFTIVESGAACPSGRKPREPVKVSLAPFTAGACKIGSAKGRQRWPVADLCSAVAAAQPERSEAAPSRPKDDRRPVPTTGAEPNVRPLPAGPGPRETGTTAVQARPPKRPLSPPSPPPPPTTTDKPTDVAAVPSGLVVTSSSWTNLAPAGRASTVRVGKYDGALDFGFRVYGPNDPTGSTGSIGRVVPLADHPGPGRWRVALSFPDCIANSFATGYVNIDVGGIAHRARFFARAGTCAGVRADQSVEIVAFEVPAP